MNMKNNQKNIKKRLFGVMLSVAMICSLASCKTGPEIDLSYNSYEVSETSREESKSSEESLSNSESSDLSDGSSEASESSEDASLDPSLIEKFPEKTISHSVMDDGNYYLKVQMVRGNYTCIREYAAKGDDVYANIRDKSSYVWYYSNGLATFSFDDEKKVYEIYSPSPLHVDLFSEVKLKEGECTFFDVESTFIEYKFDEKMSIIHFYRKTDGSWLGFQYMYEGKYDEVNLVLDASEDYPSHAVFEIPEDYKYYYDDDKGDTEVSIDWN